MPFTFSHPAVIIPFRFIGKKYFSFTGLIIGSIVPDFEYFLRIQNKSFYSHTWPGVIWFDLPLGILACFIFHNLVRAPLIMNLPYFLQIRFMSFYELNWNRLFKKNWVMVIYSLILGILTHIISDRVTHKSYHFITSVPGVEANAEILDHPNSIYRIFQITYSIIGLALCFLTVWKLPYDKRQFYYKPDFRYWLICFSIFALMLAIITTNQGFAYVDLIVSSITSLIVAFLGTSLIVLPGKKLLLLEDRYNQ